MSILNLQKILEIAERLPASARIIVKAKELMNNENSTLEELAKLISQDPILTANLLKCVNSAEMGGQTKITNIQDAAYRLGFDRVFQLLHEAAVGEMYEKQLPCYGIEEGTLLDYSIKIAQLMSLLSPRVGLDAQYAYTTGMLANIGKYVINDIYVREGILGYSEAEGYLSPQKEYDLLGYSDAEVCSFILRHWGFPEDIYLPVRQMYSMAPKSHTTSTLLLQVVVECIWIFFTLEEEAYEAFEIPAHAKEELSLTETEIIEEYLKVK